MFDIHIGAPSVLTPLIESVATSATTLDPGSFAYLPIKDQRNPVQIYIEHRHDNSTASQSIELDATEFVESLNKRTQLLVSYPQLLGKVHDVLGKRPFPLMDRRIARLNDLLSAANFTMHLMIVSPVDLIMSHSDLPLRSRLKLIQMTRLSWANIAWRILRAAPDRELVVWSCEKPFSAVEAFFGKVMPQSTLQSTFDTIGIPNRHDCRGANQASGAWMKGLEEEIMHLDDQFDVDLAKIDEMPRAALRAF